MKIEPLFKGFSLFGGADSKKDAAKKAKKEQIDIDRKIQDTDIQLRLLNDKYQVLLQKELIVARANKKRGITNSANYSRIGIAYYSLNVVRKAQERLGEISSSRELYNCMNNLNSTLCAINGLNGKTGKLNPNSIIKNVDRMSASDTGAGRDMVKTLNALSGLSMESVDKMSVDSLVSRDMIESLIDGRNVEDSVYAHEGMEHDPDDILSMISQISEEPVQEDDISLEDIEAANQSIADLISQL